MKKKRYNAARRVYEWRGALRVCCVDYILSIKSKITPRGAVTSDAEHYYYDIKLDEMKRKEYNAARWVYERRGTLRVCDVNYISSIGSEIMPRGERTSDAEHY